MHKVCFVFICITALLPQQGASIAVGEACTAHTDCTEAATSPLANSLCINAKCACKLFFTGASCAAVSCTQNSDCTDIEANSECTDGACVCADTHASDEIHCRFKCTSTGTECDANADCVDDKCICDVNYEGDGANTNCDLIACTTANVGENCVGTNDYCATNSKCACKVNYMGGSADCVRKMCTLDSECATTAFCDPDSQQCTCKAILKVGDDTCVAKDCTSENDCGDGKHVTCETSGDSKVCGCTTGYSETATSCAKVCTAANAGTTCGANAFCSNSVCTCKQGFTGDGETCSSTSGGNSVVFNPMIQLITLLSTFIAFNFGKN